MTPSRDCILVFGDEGGESDVLCVLDSATPPFLQANREPRAVRLKHLYHISPRLPGAPSTLKPD